MPMKAPKGTLDELMQEPLHRFCTTADAARITGMHQKHIQRLVRDKRVRYVMLGHDTLIYLPSLQDYQHNKSRRGRPPGKPSN